MKKIKLDGTNKYMKSPKPKSTGDNNWRGSTEDKIKEFNELIYKYNRTSPVFESGDPLMGINSKMQKKLSNFLSSAVKEVREEVIEGYRYYKKSGLQIDFLEYMGYVEKEPLPEEIQFMGGTYELQSNKDTNIANLKITTPSRTGIVNPHLKK